MDKAKVIFLGAVAIILLAVAYYSGIFNKNVESVVSQTATSTEVTKGGVTATGDFTIEEVSDRPAMPNLNKAVLYDPKLPKEAITILRAKIAEIIASIYKTPNVYSLWFNLGLYKKSAGDYQGALEAWNYALYLTDKDAVLHSNLGSLYGYDLGKAELAKQHYKKSIELEPYIANWYVRSAMFYKEVLNDKAMAKTILEAGLKQLPNDQSLTSALNNL